MRVCVPIPGDEPDGPESGVLTVHDFMGRGASRRDHIFSHQLFEFGNTHTLQVDVARAHHDGVEETLPAHGAVAAAFVPPNVHFHAFFPCQQPIRVDVELLSGR